MLLPRGVHWRNFHIRRLVYFFPSVLVVFRICFLILIRIYLLYLCCSIGPSHSVWWSLFVWRFFVGLTVFSPWLFTIRKIQLQKEVKNNYDNNNDFGSWFQFFALFLLFAWACAVLVFIDGHWKNRFVTRLFMLICKDALDLLHLHITHYIVMTYAFLCAGWASVVCNDGFSHTWIIIEWWFIVYWVDND